MILDSHFQGFIWSNKSSVPSALLLSLQILAGNLCCSSRGKILKQMNIKEVVRGEGLAVSILHYSMKKKKVVLSLNGWDLLISPQLPVLHSPPACLSMHVF